MTRIKSSENITKSIEQIMGIHKWSRGLEELSDKESIGQNTLTEGWKLKIQHHDISSKS